MKHRCPTCRGAAVKEGNKLYPFCSERCHQIDLGRWLLEDYRIPDQTTDPTGADGIGDPESEN